MADSNKPKYPPGFRFVPKDEELIIYYLQLKIDNQPIPVDEITEVDLYANNPKVLAEECPSLGENEWYFFTPRERKYRNGLRPKRSAENGYWKATGSDKPILFETRTVGYKKSLVFYQGLPQKGTKTDWIMHEFRLNRPPRTRTNASDMKLDDWVLCRIYKKASKPNNNNNNNSSGLAIVPPAESDHVTTPDQVDPIATVASTDDPVYKSSLQVFEEQGQQAEVQGFEEQQQLQVAPLQTFEQVAPLQGFEQEPLMPLVAPPNHYHYCNDTQLADNIGFDEGFSDSWYENLTLEPLALSENKYRPNGYGIEQAAYWPQNDRNWNLVTHNDGDFTSLSQSNNGTTFSSSSSASVQSYGSYCCYIENQVSSYVPQLGSLVDSSMKSKAPPLINPPDHNQPRPRKRVRAYLSC